MNKAVFWMHSLASNGDFPGFLYLFLEHAKSNLYLYFVASTVIQKETMKMEIKDRGIPHGDTFNWLHQDLFKNLR